MELTVAEIAEKLEGALEGDKSLRVSGVAGLREAGEGSLSFVANPRYAGQVAETKATAVLVPRNWERPSGALAMIRVDDPDAAFAKASVWFAPPAPPVEKGVHPTAVVAPSAKLGEGVCVGPHAVIEPGVVIGARTVISAQCYVGHDTAIGEDCRLYPLASIRERCVLGNRVILHNGAVVGSDGFGYAPDKNGVRHKIAQTGIVVIGDDVEIGANTTVDRARFGKTRIGNGVKIDNLVQVGHNAIIGDHTVIVAQGGVAGSAEIGKRVILAGQCAVSGHITVGDGAILGGQCGVTKDVPPGAILRGTPAGPMEEVMRQEIMVRRLPKLKAALEELAKRVKDLEDRANG